MTEKPKIETANKPDIIFSFKTRERSSTWYCQVAGCNYFPPKGDEPNWFRRLMQRLILGFKWRKQTEPHYFPVSQEKGEK
jgi:hypothetical protein